MDSEKIRQKFLDFFKERGHTIVPSSSLIPDDPSVLFTTAGMQQFKRYFTGELDPVKDFGSKNTVSIQKCFRTSDIDSVGDESHLTFFEMLGNFSFGGYWKKEAIEYAHEFITKEMGLEIQYVSVFKGDPSTSSGQAVPADEESEKICKSLGLEVKRHGREDNFWGPTGNEGPCGPTTEIYINDVEVWNIVFNEYYSKDGKLTPLKIKGVDTGMGLERLAVVSQGVKNVYETDLFKTAFKREVENEKQSLRILLDHLRGAIFLIIEGIQPSNKEAGYILRRLIRRVAFRVRKLTGESESGGFKLGLNEIKAITKNGISFYKDVYPELVVKENDILETLEREYDRFAKVFYEGMREFDRIHDERRNISGKDAFHIYQSFGLPREVIRDVCLERNLKFNDAEFDEEFAKHQEISRAGAEKKFGGHGLILDTGELKAGSEEELAKATKLHTATHLLHQALRETLGESVKQEGSDVTAERARFDFSFQRKLTPEELKKIEERMNEKIKENLTVSFKEMPKGEAEKTGALHFFKQKYPDMVKVYFISPDGKPEHAWSKEFCGGPHVSHTEEIGDIKILKEEASSAGIRRIRIGLVGN